MENRQQHIFVKGVRSNYNKIKYGVPQGSCFGPLLFLIFINDISAYVEEDLLSLYADDTAALMTDGSFHVMNKGL